MTALWKGFNALGRHSRLLPKALGTLSNLYQRNDEGPRGHATRLPYQSSDDDDDDDQNPYNDPHIPDKSSGFPTPGAGPSRGGADGRTSGMRRSGRQAHGKNPAVKKRHHNQGEETYDKDEETREPKRTKVKNSPWVWGPHKSSKDHLEWHNHMQGEMRKWKRKWQAENIAQPVIAQLPSPEVSEFSEINSVKVSHGVRLDVREAREVLKWLDETKPTRYVSRRKGLKGPVKF